jgi:hypothetical protein
MVSSWSAIICFPRISKSLQTKIPAVTHLTVVQVFKDVLTWNMENFAVSEWELEEQWCELNMDKI